MTKAALSPGPVRHPSPSLGDTATLTYKVQSYSWCTLAFSCALLAGRFFVDKFSFFFLEKRGPQTAVTQPTPAPPNCC